MDPQLSNAVSHAFLRVLDATIHHIEWKSFLLIFGSTSWEHVDVVFTLYQFIKWHCLLPRGQQKLTIFSDRVEEGLSYLQLFLELPETVWSLQNRSYIKKHHFWCNMSPFVKANLTFGLIYKAFRNAHWLSLKELLCMNKFLYNCFVWINFQNREKNVD